MRILRLIFLAGLCAASLPYGSADTLCNVVIVSRHGVRSPTVEREELNRYSREPWPQWDVPTGYLTARGKRLMALMGAYYRDRYTAAGLLTGRPKEDRARIFFHANNLERTLETGRGLALGLLNETNPDLHAAPTGTFDPLFYPEKVHLGRPDMNAQLAAIRARMGPDPAAFVQGYREQFRIMENVLFGPGSVRPPAGKVPLLSLPVTLQLKDNLLSCKGPTDSARTITETFILEYAENRPMAEVGWGRVTPATIAAIYGVHAVDFDLTDETPAVAEAQGSNLADHILRTLEQGVTGRALPEALSPPDCRLTVAVGHDTNQANLAGLLGLSWSVGGLGLDPVLPGGALVFELWRHDDGRFFVRTYYMAQTLDQMRGAQPLTAAAPPAIAAIFVPGSGSTGTDFEAPWEDFAAHFRKMINPRFVAR